MGLALTEGTVLSALTEGTRITVANRSARKGHSEHSQTALSVLEVGTLRTHNGNCVRALWALIEDSVGTNMGYSRHSQRAI